MCMSKRKNNKKRGYLQPAVSSDWRKPAVNGYRPKKKKEKRKEKKERKEKKSCVYQ